MPIKERFRVLEDKGGLFNDSYFNLKIKFNFKFNLVNYNFN